MKIEQCLKLDNNVNSVFVSDNEKTLEQILAEADNDRIKGRLLPMSEVFAYFDELIKI